MTKVLVTDDNHDHTERLASLFAMMGHDASTAHDRQQAVAAVTRMRPDIVVMDIPMPVLDGYGAARAMRRLHPESRLTLVALTAIGGEAARRQAMEAGYDVHLTRPLDFDTVLALVEKAGGRHPEQRFQAQPRLVMQPR